MTSFKKGEKHTNTKITQEEKLRAIKWYSIKRFNGIPPSHGLMRIYIYVTIISCCVTGFLAFLAYNNSVTIKGMEQVLKTFNANVRWTPQSYNFNGDTMIMEGIVRNFGTRVATNISVQSYLIIKEGIYELDPQEAVADLLPLENFKYQVAFPDTIASFIDKTTPQFLIGSKVKFYDPVTETLDSNYSFTSTYSKLQHGKLAIANKEETQNIKMKIRAMNLNFMP